MAKKKAAGKAPAKKMPARAGAGAGAGAGEKEKAAMKKARAKFFNGTAAEYLIYRESRHAGSEKVFISKFKNQ